MQLEHSFTVPVGIDKAWATLLDIEQVAPCMPGAALDSVEGDDFTGTVKVRLGPIGLTYKGKASFLDKDETKHKAVIGAQGKDSRGNGTAAATVTATMTDKGEETEVHVVTDLNITGKPAQFGRGVMTDVGNKLIGQFADCLAGKLGATDDVPATVAEAATEAAAAQQPAESAVGGTPAVAAPEPVVSASASTPQPGARPRHVAADPEPINLMASAGPALAKRLAPLAVALLVLLIVLGRRRRG